jgi:hypothetical protein
MVSSTLLSLAARTQLCRGARRFSSAATAGPVRRTVSMEERTALRAARRERANKFLAKARGTPSEDSAAASIPGSSLLSTRWVWYLGVTVPTVLLAWGYNDENSPPAKLSKAIGLTDWLTSWTEQFAQPSHDKLLPDWSQVSTILVKVFDGRISSHDCELTCLAPCVPMPSALAPCRCQMSRMTFPFRRLLY